MESRPPNLLGPSPPLTAVFKLKVLSVKAERGEGSRRQKNVKEVRPSP